MAIDFRESYPVVEWNLNHKMTFLFYSGSLDDSANGFKLTVIQGSDVLTPSTETVRFYCEKPDNTRVYQDATIDGDYFVIDLPNQVFAVAGKVKCNFQISSNGEWKTSPQFIINVDDNNIAGSIESTSEFVALQNALDTVDNLTAQVDTAVQDANTAIANINTAISDSETATANANQATSDANTATANAITATNDANTATTNANNATDSANTATTNANTSASNADTATSNANTATTNANQATTDANNAATSANNAATNANNVATQLENETLQIFKDSVSTYADLATTYPTPENAWTVTVNDEMTSYRYNGTDWINLGYIATVDTATDTTVGIVKGGGNVSIDVDGTMNVPDVGDLTQLQTASNTDLVGAINEVHTKKVAKGEFIINVKDYGAKGDGLTDDSTAINNALTYCANNGGGTVFLPIGQYYVASKITINAKCALAGFIMSSDMGSGNIQIVGALSLPLIIELNGGSGSSQTSLRNISVTRASGAIPSGSIGVQVNSTDYTSIIDVIISRQAIGLDLEGNLGCKCERVMIYSNSETYCIINNMPQPTFIDCSFGRNGGEFGVNTATDIIQIKGSADTISFIRCQINPTVSGITNAINFKGYGNVNGYIYFTNCHIENTTNIIVSDSSTAIINRLILNACTISNVTTNPFISLNSETSIGEWIISNCIITGTITLIKGETLNLSNNRISGAVRLELAQANVTGNIFNTGVVLNGVWSNLVFSNNIFDGTAQIITDNSTGRKCIFGNVSTTGYSNPCILPDNYLQLGSGVSFGIKEYTGTLGADGTATFTHGLTNVGHLHGLICQAYYKGTAEMLPMTVSYIDGSSIVIGGGLASAHYRVTFIYSKEADTNW